MLEFLNKCKPDKIISNVGSHGIIAIFNGNNSGKNILFRSELDALPITESNDFDHKSVTQGVSHKCGHDGHSTILCGLAKIFSENRPIYGDAILLFQPAEETGEGAAAVARDNYFKSLKIDFAFALHNIPGAKLGEVIVKDGTFSCAVNSIIIKLTGKTSHAAEPHNGINPANAISEILNGFSKINQSEISKKDFCIVTPVHIMMGEKAYGVSAGHGELHFTLRSDKNAATRIKMQNMEKLATEISAKNNLQIEITWTEEFRANENDSDAVEFVRKAASKNNLALLEKATPFSWGEDFGLLTQTIPGAMFGLGAGENCPALHNPDYDFPDELISIGTTMFYEIWSQINAQ